MSKHTPGPWKAHFEESYFVTGPDLGRVAMMMNLKGAHGLGGRRTGDESAANCRLIAAAPDLLEALREFLVMTEEPPESNCSCHIAPPCADCVNHSGLREAFDIARAAIAKATGEQA